MKIRNIKKRIRMRFAIYVMLRVILLFLLLMLYRFVAGFFERSELISYQETELIVPIEERTEGSTILMEGIIYRKIISTKPVYVLFAEDSLKYIIDNEKSVWLDENLGENITLEGKIQKFVGSVPYVTINK